MSTARSALFGAAGFVVGMLLAWPAAAGAEPALRAPRAPTQFVRAAVVDQRRTQADARYASRDEDGSPAALMPFNTPAASPRFKGIADSARTCVYTRTCEPADPAIAASTAFVVEAVNDAVAVFGPTGTLAAGFPKTAQTFFGIPNPSPSNCDPHGPYTAEPRAFYDRADRRFYVDMMQVEGDLGVGAACAPLSKIWIAVSQTSDPTAGWNVYAVDMDFSSAGYALDGAQLGFDDVAAYFGGNMFGPAAKGSPFEYDEIFFGAKSVMESGGTLAVNGFFDMMAGGGTIDTLQPVETQTTFAQRPGVEYLVASENIAFGGGHCAAGCNGLDVYGISDPLGSPSLTGVHITIPAYSLAPFADEPGCSKCIDTYDTRISADPVYTAARGGVISFALETAAASGNLTVPGVLWGEVQPSQSGGSVTGATLLQSGTITGTGDEANAYGATMASPDGSLWIVDDRMSATLAPSIAYRVQRATDPLGTLESVRTLRNGSMTNQSLWGRYAAASLDDAGYVWLVSQYARTSGDWSTFIGRDI